MIPANHDPEDTAQEVTNLTSPEHPLATPLEKLGEAAERLQTWASDTASKRSRKPSMSPVEARADRVRGEQLLADVLSCAAPVLGELGSVGGGGQ